MVKETTVIIIGGGPAGLAAAVQLERFRIPFVLFEKKALGGLLRNANLVENCPGFPDGISGLNLAGLLEKQASAFSEKICFGEVVSLDFQENLFTTSSKELCVRSRFAVIASGTKPVRLDILEADEEIKPYVLYEIFPIRRIKAKSIGILGAGDAAFDYALTLCPDNRVFILGRKSEVRCLPVLFQKAERIKTITFLPERELRSVKRIKGKLAASFFHKGVVEDFDFDYIVPAVGRTPELGFYSKALRKNRESLEAARRIFPVGDVVNEGRRQFAIASGNGIEAAMKIREQL